MTGSSTAIGRSAFDSCAPMPSSAPLREQLDDDLERPPDKTLAFWSEMPLLYGDDGTKTDERDHLPRVPDAPRRRRATPAPARSAG